MSDQRRYTDYLLLEEIKPYDRNPKEHADEKLRESIERFGFTNAMLVCERRRELAEGHGRLGVLEAMQAEGAPLPSGILIDDEGKWLAPVQRGWASQNDQEFQDYVVAANQLVIAGGWDNENLLGLLTETENFKGVGFEPDDVDELRRLLAGIEEHTSTQKPYTKVINVPQYEPVGPPPPLEELLDTTRRDELVRSIQQSDIPNELRPFLIQAAQRHTVINYRKVAEYYPHAIPEVQRLMEESALVIIDYEDAIRLGYVKLDATIEELNQRAGSPVE